MVDAPVSRLPSITPGKEDEENIYTTSPNKIPVSNPVSVIDTVEIIFSSWFIPLLFAFNYSASFPLFYHLKDIQW